MKSRAENRSLLIFYFLVGYVILQFCWWAYHIISLTKETSTDNAFVHRRVMMIAGEASVFLLVLVVGVFYVRKSFKKELQLNKEKKNFILSVTHELKTPIASSKLFVDTLLNRDLPVEKQRDLLCKIGKDQNRLTKLVENILLVSKVEEQAVSIQKSDVRLRQFVQTIVENMGGESDTEVNIPDDLMVHIDGFYFTSVIQNLQENAMKYSGSGIVWEGMKKGDSVCLRIKDTGPGIPQEEKDKIFKMFYRVGDENTRQSKGTGLGLYLVNEIVSLHNGTIVIKDNSPQGSIFEIEI